MCVCVCVCVCVLVCCVLVCCMCACVCVCVTIDVRISPVPFVLSYPVPQESDPFFIPFTLTDYGMNKVSGRGEVR